MHLWYTIWIIYGYFSCIPNNSAAKVSAFLTTIGLVSQQQKQKRTKFKQELRFLNIWFYICFFVLFTCGSESGKVIWNVQNQEETPSFPQTGDEEGRQPVSACYHMQALSWRCNNSAFKTEPHFLLRDQIVG